jgi:hypothetical protein
MTAEERRLCAGCGCEIRPDYWQPPETSLCQECEDKIRAGRVPWPGPAQEEHSL